MLALGGEDALGRSDGPGPSVGDCDVDGRGLTTWLGVSLLKVSAVLPRSTDRKTSSQSLSIGQRVELVLIPLFLEESLEPLRSRGTGGDGDGGLCGVLVDRGEGSDRGGWGDGDSLELFIISVW